MEPKIMTVTPEMARGWLETQHDNRPPNKSLVDSLRRAIEMGRWDITNPKKVDRSVMDQLWRSA